jgi:hypothetical protein
MGFKHVKNRISVAGIKKRKFKWILLVVTGEGDGELWVEGRSGSWRLGFNYCKLSRLLTEKNYI